MITVAAFVAAAVPGALARAEAGRRWNHHNGLAVGTSIVNVTGSFLLGLLSDTAPTTMTVLGVAGLGAFTTFSSFARDAVALVELRRHFGHRLSAATDLDRGFNWHATTDARNSIGDGIEGPRNRDVQCDGVLTEGDWLIGRDQFDAVGIGERGRATLIASAAGPSNLTQ